MITLPQTARTVVCTLARNNAIVRLKAANRALSTTPHLAQPLSGVQNSSLPFSFLPANSLAPKTGRQTGLTEIRGPYYAPVTQTYLDELLSDWGEYVDGIKFAGGAFSLMPEERLKSLIDTAHKHGRLSESLCSLLV